MLSYNKILYKLSPLRYIVVIFLIIISSFMNILDINSVIHEKDMYLYLVYIGLNQFITLLQYIMIRVLYPNELLLMKDDSIHIFMQNQKSRFNVFKNKISQISLFIIIKFIFTIIFVMLFSIKSESIYLIVSSATISAILIIFVYLIDFINMNKMTKNNFESILGNIILVEIIALFYNPNVLLSAICLATILITTLVNINIVRRNLL